MPGIFHTCVYLCNDNPSGTPRLLAATVYVLYVTVGKMASGIRHSHTISWNACPGRGTVRLRWTTSI